MLIQIHDLWSLTWVMMVLRCIQWLLILVMGNLHKLEAVVFIEKNKKYNFI